MLSLIIRTKNPLQNSISFGWHFLGRFICLTCSANPQYRKVAINLACSFRLPTGFSNRVLATVPLKIVWTKIGWAFSMATSLHHKNDRFALIKLFKWKHSKDAQSRLWNSKSKKGMLFSTQKTSKMIFWFGSVQKKKQFNFHLLSGDCFGTES